MQAIINPGNLSGTINIPPSKSIMQRACACALLHKGKTIIANPGNSNDDVAAVDIIQQLGADIEYPDKNLVVTHKDDNAIADIIDCHESGLAARLFIPIAALHEKEITITGSGSLLNRTMEAHLSALPELGVEITSDNGCLPIVVKGPLQTKDVTIDGSVSSQFLSGLLIALSFTATVPVTITVNELKSKPYIDLTLQMLEYFGKKVEHDNYRSFLITPTEDHDTVDIYINIETDWSSAANFKVAKSLGADITIDNLNNDSLQADKAILDVITDTNDSFDFDATDCPDLFPILSVYAARCNGESSITGLHRLMHKESDRAATIMEMLNNLGVESFVEEDTLVIHGNAKFKSCTINAHNDHRIAMAAAIAALYADGKITIEDASAVNKSFPAFFETLINGGVDCQLVN